MESWTWGEFLSVWIPICIILDVVFVAMEKFGSKATTSHEEERRQKKSTLNTRFKDDVSYNMESRSLSMRTVETVQSKEDELPPDSEVEGDTVATEDDDEDEEYSDEVRNLTYLEMALEKSIEKLKEEEQKNGE